MIVPHRRLLPGVLLAAVLAAGACGGAQDDAEPATVSSTGDAVAGEADPAAAPSPLPPPGTPWTAADSLRAVEEDSLYELRILRRRQASMASYAECMESAKGLEQPQRRTIEAACGRTRGASTGNSPP